MECNQDQQEDKKPLAVDFRCEKQVALVHRRYGRNEISDEISMNIVFFKSSGMLFKLKGGDVRSSRFPCFTLHLAPPEPPGTRLSAEDALELRGLRSHETESISIFCEVTYTLGITGLSVRYMIYSTYR